MNKEKDKTTESKPSKKGNQFARTFIGIISGSFLTKENTLKYLPFFLFVSILTMLYIANGYYAESMVRRMNKLSNELKELRSEYIYTKSDLMFLSKQSEVATAAISIGMTESVEPPKKIVYTKNNNTAIKTKLGD